jgi:hypothetical protein
MNENNWQFDHDPFRLIKRNSLIDNGCTKIIGFAAPAGVKFDRLMVYIEYPNGGTTTRSYLSALEQLEPEIAKNIRRRIGVK